LVVKIPGLKTKLNVKNYLDDQRSDVSLVQKLSRTRMAFKCCIRTDSRWNKNMPSRASLETAEILHPKSSTKRMADSLIGPRVSSATGWNIKEAGILSYYFHYLLLLDRYLRTTYRTRVTVQSYVLFSLFARQRLQQKTMPSCANSRKTSAVMSTHLRWFQLPQLEHWIVSMPHAFSQTLHGKRTCLGISF